MFFELDPKDMLTVISGDTLKYLDVFTGEKAKGTPYEAQPFGEASSMRKFNGKYYFIYSSLNSHNLCWAVSDRPDGGFTYGGVLVSCGDIGLPGVPDVKHAHNCTGNTHGSLIEINGKYFVFYHRHSNRKQSSRQACAEEIRFENGRFHQAEMTSCGLNAAPLSGKGTYPSYIACNVYGKNGTRFMSMFKYPKSCNPYLTQRGGDRESGEDQYVANLCEGCTVAYKYFDLTETAKLTVRLRGRGDGTVVIRTKEQGKPVCRIPVTASSQEKDFSAGMTGKPGNREALFFTLEGNGHFDLISFTLA